MILCYLRRNGDVTLNPDGQVTHEGGLRALLGLLQEVLVAIKVLNVINTNKRLLFFVNYLYVVFE